MMESSKASPARSAPPIARAYRFGAWLKSLDSPSACVQLAQRAEHLGYSTVFVSEHLDTGYGPFAMASALASATSVLRVGTLMLLNDLRHPAVLAKEAAALDVLSEGRLELGIGAGWKDSDYTSIGLCMPKGPVRVQRLRESITVVKGLFADGPFSFSGMHYTIANLEGLPKPRQRPHPPFIVGGASRAIMALAAAEANIAGINPALRAGPLPADSVSMKAAEATVGHLIESAGERMAHIEVNLFPLKVVVTPHSRAAVAEVARAYRLDEEAVSDSPFFLVGSTAAIEEKLRMLREKLLVSYVVVREEAMTGFAEVAGRLAGVTDG